MAKLNQTDKKIYELMYFVFATIFAVWFIWALSQPYGTTVEIIWPIIIGAIAFYSLYKSKGW